MPRSFSSSDAKQLIRAHKEILSSLRQVREQCSRARNGVKSAADAMVTAEVTEVLKGVPVEELNRDKRGIKVKTLRDSGYLTLADLAGATANQLAAINGIGDESAYLIRGILDGMLEEGRKETKIRLSEDRKTPASTALVTEISRFRRFSPLAERAAALMEGPDPQLPQAARITAAFSDLEPAESGLMWFFTGSARKRKAEAAYEYLAGLLDGAPGRKSYGTEARQVIRLAKDAAHLGAATAWGDFHENSIRFFSVMEEIVPGVLGSADAVYGLTDDLARDIQEEEILSDGLLCELRRYQKWGVKYILHQKRVLLGDEMGLGKTVQAIAAMVSLQNNSKQNTDEASSQNGGVLHFLVVCPASVVTNWCRELEDKSTLQVTKVHGALRDLALDSWIRTGGVAVTTYETTWLFLQRFKKDANTGSLDTADQTEEVPQDGFLIDMLAADEAHYIKNPQAQRTMNLKSLAGYADRLLFMTGTALENRVGEMISLIGILQPEIADQVRGMEYLAAAPQFRQKVAPVYYRRRREDVLTELPELIEEKEWCTLLPEEEAVYEQAVLSRRYADARRVSWSVNDVYKSSKANRMLELIGEAESEGRKVLVFSFFLDTLGKVSSLLGGRCMPVIHGSVPPARRQEIVDAFDKAPAGTVLAAQIQSGGTGLNIQSASVVILCEPQLKPSAENQAISRAYRMGQTRNVLVFRLLCDDTVDEKIMDLLEEKQAVFDAFADRSDAAEQSVALDEKTLNEIIESEIERIKAKHAGTIPE